MLSNRLVFACIVLVINGANVFGIALPSLASDEKPTPSFPEADYALYMSNTEKRIKAVWQPGGVLKSAPANEKFPLRTIVLFDVLADGTITNTRVKRSSGFLMCDQAALDALKKASPLQALPKQAGARIYIEFTFDITSNRNNADHQTLGATSIVDIGKQYRDLKKVGDALYAQKNYKAAEQAYQKEFELAKRNHADLAELDAYVNVHSAIWRQSKADALKQYAAQLQLARKYPNTEMSQQYLFEYASELTAAGETEKALAMFKEAFNNYKLCQAFPYARSVGYLKTYLSLANKQNRTDDAKAVQLWLAKH